MYVPIPLLIAGALALAIVIVVLVAKWLDADEARIAAEQDLANRHRRDAFNRNSTQ